MSTHNHCEYEQEDQDVLFQELLKRGLVNLEEGPFFSERGGCFSLQLLFMEPSEKVWVRDGFKKRSDFYHLGGRGGSAGVNYHF